MLIFSPYNKLFHPLALAAIIMKTQNISYFTVHFIILSETFFTTPCRPSSALTFPLSLPPNNSTSLSTVQTWVVRRAVWLPPLSNPSSSIPIAYNTTSQSQSSPLPWSDEWARCGAALQCRRGRGALPGLGGPVDRRSLWHVLQHKYFYSVLLVPLCFIIIIVAKYVKYFSFSKRRHDLSA